MFSSRTSAANCVPATLAWGCLLVFTAFAADEPLKIGVLANRGEEEAFRRWGPTADYLSTQIASADFKIVPLDFDAVFKAVESGDVDFVIANSGNYVEMEVLYGVSRIVTLKNLRNGVVCKYFGGVIFTRADRSDIQQLSDLKGKTFQAVDERSLGGWQMAWREMKDQGVNPYSDFSALSFGGTHDAIVYAVRDGKVDAGTVRTDLFERVATEGRIDLSQFRILNPQTKTTDFPFMHSTRLYPEWPMAKLRHTSDDIAQKVASALLNMPANSPAAKACESAGWTVPLDYSAVHECLRELRVRPYENFGRITPADVFREYRWQILLSLLLVAGLIAFVARHMRLNQFLVKTRRILEAELAERKKAEAGLQAAQVDLEKRVAERTAELAGANEGLKAEIAERGRALAALNASEQRFRQLAENIRQVFWINNLEKTEMYYVSPAYQEIFGRPVDDLYRDPRSFIDCIHPDDRDAVIQSLPRQKDGGWVQEYRIVHPDGKMKWARASAFPVRNENGEVYRMAGLVEDITERRTLEQQFAQIQKMEAIGQLAGGIAHDFNNLLTVMAACCDQVLQKQSDPLVKSNVDLLQATIQRGATLTRQLLAFSRRQTLAPKILDLNAVVRDMTAILKRLIGENIVLELKLSTKLGRIRADASQIEQVVMNLCVNARDAMPRGGRLCIETSNTSPDSFGGAPRVMLSVADTGCGMDEVTQCHIFEPFFTTKKMGEGSGLGLPTVDGIVRQSGGTIEFQSQVGRGTTFRIYLPAVEEALDVKPSEEPPSVPRGSETILLVEDDEIVRATTTTLLAMRGYVVLQAVNGAEALKVFEARRREISLIVTDMMMPVMGGWDLGQRILALQPDACIVFMSGYMPDELQRKGIEKRGLAFLQKPFTQRQLEAKIRETLDCRCQTGT